MGADRLGTLVPWHKPNATGGAAVKTRRIGKDSTVWENGYTYVKRRRSFEGVFSVLHTTF